MAGFAPYIKCIQRNTLSIVARFLMRSVVGITAFLIFGGFTFGFLEMHRLEVFRSVHHGGGYLQISDALAFLHDGHMDYLVFPTCCRHLES